MTTDYQTPTDYRAATGYDDAMAEARLAGDGGPIDGFVERMAERVGGQGERPRRLRRPDRARRHHRHPGRQGPLGLRRRRGPRPDRRRPGHRPTRRPRR